MLFPLSSFLTRNILLKSEEKNLWEVMSFPTFFSLIFEDVLHSHSHFVRLCGLFSFCSPSTEVNNLIMAEIFFNGKY